MVEPGGLQDIIFVKFAVLYTASLWGKPIPYRDLTEVLLQDGLVDFFDLSIALDELLQTSHLLLSEQGQKRSYQITPDGETAISLFQNQIPFSVREKITKAAKFFHKHG